MRIVIVGAGEVGAYLARFLVAEHHNVSLVDSDPERIEHISDQLDVKGYVGSGTCVATLEEADVGNADLLLAMTNSEQVNMLASLFSKKLGVTNTIARMDSEDALIGHPGFYRRHLGIDKVINPAMLAAAEATAIIQAGCGSGIGEFGFGRIYFRPFDVADGSPATKKPLSGLHLPGALIAAVVRNGNVLIPGGDDTLIAGDRLVVICKPEAIPYVQKAVGESKDHIRRLIIVGGGAVGAAVAKYFDSPRYRVKLFEDDRRRAWELANSLNYVKVIEGDGADLEVLEEEYLATAEAFVTSTGSDEKNLMTAVLAREHGVARTIAVVDKPQSIELGKQLSITATLAPRILAANQVMAFVHGGNVNRVALIAEGQAEIIEFQAGAGLSILGKPFRELDLPRGIIVAALIRGPKALIPGGGDEIREGDSVVLFSLQERISYVESLLKQNNPPKPKRTQAVEQE